MKLSAVLAILTAAAPALTLPASQNPSSRQVSNNNKAKGEPLPVVIWHGLGDRYDADGLASVGELINHVHPGTYVYNIRISDDGDDDQKATFIGNIDRQLEMVCDALVSNPNLTASSAGPGTATGRDAGARFDAMGFSQGGQFLRGLVERCPGISVRSLVTFGSQHNGINQFSTCGTWDLLCKAALAAAKGRAFSTWAQGNVIPAQYYRQVDPDTGLGTDAYLNASHFLADVNNERRAHHNPLYKQRLQRLEHFAMYVFENDTTAIPKESGWFDEVIDPKDDQQRTVIPLRRRLMYVEDWLGLKVLDERGALSFRLVKDAGHMQLDEDLLKTAFEDFFGDERRSAAALQTSWWRSVLGQDQNVLT